MQREINYNDVDWMAARCRGISTDLFFLEEEFLRARGLEFELVRSVCFSCPIQRQCLEWAFASNERYGMWGGVSGYERNAIRRKDFDNQFVSALKVQLEKYGVPFEEIIEASEAKVVKNERSFAESD